MKVMYLDESGNHDLKKVNPTYPVFVLGGIIADRKYVREVIDPEMRQFKMAYFGRDDVILHTVEMGRGRDEYGFLADPAKRHSFYSELNDLLRLWEYKIVACVFELNRYIAQYHAPVDPYHYGLEILIERFCKELGHEEDSAILHAEKRNPGLDKELMSAWERLASPKGRTEYLHAGEINRKIVDFSLKEKNSNIAGLQVADLVITPIGRHIAERPIVPNQVQWSVVEGKLRRGPGSYKGYGLIIRPSK